MKLILILLFFVSCSSAPVDQEVDDSEEKNSWTEYIQDEYQELH